MSLRLYLAEMGFGPRKPSTPKQSLAGTVSGRGHARTQLESWSRRLSKEGREELTLQF